MNVETMKENPFLAILRHVDYAHVPDVINALYDGGIRAIEITFNPSRTDTIQTVTRSIDWIKQRYGNAVRVGAGTVLTTEFAQAACQAGGEFIVSPCIDEAVIAFTKEKGLLSIPGAFTPTEIMQAYRYGADVVKVFPILPDNIDYLKVIMSPLSHIPFIVTGGVNPQTIPALLGAGAIAVAAGATLMTPELIRSKNFAAITENAKAHMAAIKQAR